MGGVKKAVKKVVKNPIGTAIKLGTGSIAGIDTPISRLAQGKGLIGRDMAATLGLTPAQVEMSAGGAFAKGGIDPVTGEYISPMEMESGIRMPKYESLRDPTSGKLKSDFAFDPYQGEMTQKLKSEATGTGFSPWASAKLDSQKLEEQSAKDLAARQGQQAMSQGISSLARVGGVSSGARERIAGQSARDMLLAKQDVSRQGMAGRADILTEDLARKQGLQGDFANAEQKAQAANLEAMRSDVSGKQQFDLSKYKDLMAAYGASKSSDAQRAAAKQSSGKK